jgi:hypothetical protein
LLNQFRISVRAIHRLRRNSALIMRWFDSMVHLVVHIFSTMSSSEQSFLRIFVGINMLGNSGHKFGTHKFEDRTFSLSYKLVSFP